MTQCLIVDDSKVVRKLARKIIETIGYTVDEAEDGSVAEQYCLHTKPDLILLDWYMPVMDGITFLRKLRTMPGGDNPVVIFCTTATDMSNITEAISSGANEYVMKPFDESIIRAKLVQLGLLET